jgi:hypothetical protein
MPATALLLGMGFERTAGGDLPDDDDPRAGAPFGYDRRP